MERQGGNALVVVWSLLVSLGLVQVKGEDAPKLFQKPLIPLGEQKAETTQSSTVVSKEGNRETKDQKPFTPFVNRVGEPVHIEAKVYELAPGSGLLATSDALKQVENGTARLLSSPVFATGMGSWTRHETTHRISVPSEYHALSIPEALEGKVQGGSNGEPLKVNKGGVIVPGVPSNFAEKDLGLKIKFRPRAGSKSSLTVDCELDQSILKGFVDIGKPVTREKENPIGKNAKIEVLLDNDMEEAVFAEQSERVEFVIGKDSGPTAKVLFANSSGGTQAVGATSSELYQSGLRPLLVVLDAKRSPVIATPSILEPGQARPQIYLACRIIEIQEETGHEDLGVLSSLRSQSIYTDPQFQMMIRALSQKKGVDLLSAPSIVLRNAQQGRIEVSREFVYPTKYDPPQISVVGSAAETGEVFPMTPATPTEFTVEKTGISFQVLAQYMDDGSIEMKMRLNNSEPQGFLNFGEAITTVGKNAWGKRVPVVISENRILTPVFRKRMMETTTRIPDGSSVCLGGFVTHEVQILEDKIPLLGDLPGIGQLGRKRVELNTQRKLYVFLKAMAVDNTGQPIGRKN